MRLYLGKGSLLYLHHAEAAVRMWNEALTGFTRGPVIEIVRDRCAAAA